LQQHARLGGIQLTRGHEALLVVVHFVVAQRDARRQPGFVSRLFNTLTRPS
jgi:hypothetical protein